MTKVTPVTAQRPADAAGDPRPWTVSGLAREAGTAADTIRYYEKIGLLPPPMRTSGSHRRYGPAALDRLRFIQGVQRLGLRLDQVADLLAVRDTGKCACEPAGQLLRRRIAEVEDQISQLTDLHTRLTEMLACIPASDCPDPSPGTWRTTASQPRGRTLAGRAGA